MVFTDVAGGTSLYQRHGDDAAMRGIERALGVIARSPPPTGDPGEIPGVVSPGEGVATIEKIWARCP